MIPNKIRGGRRTKTLKLPKNLERLYKEGKCRECAVVVTRMDFAKILGKFTKVKIQYESSKTPKTKQNSQMSMPNSITRLKSNENGLVMLHRKSSNQKPVKVLPSPKTIKAESPRCTPNILKENNRLKRTILKDKNTNNNNYGNQKKTTVNLKHYGIVFEDPLVHNNNNDVNCKISLTDLLSQINDSILPSEDWCIDFFPKKGEPKDDKVFDRIAAELEDLMYNEKPGKTNDKIGTMETKVDEFPSIMDILNDNSSDNKPNDQSTCLEFKSNLESSDVEAMLLGKTNPETSPVAPAPMDVDNSNVSNLIEDVNLVSIPENVIPESTNKLPGTDIKLEEIENPQSPSILDEALQKGIEEHLPSNVEKSIEEPSESVERSVSELIEKSVSESVEKSVTESFEDLNKNNPVVEPEQIKHEETSMESSDTKIDIEKDVEKKVNKADEMVIDKMEESKEAKSKLTNCWASIEGITHLVFKKTKDGSCFKSVICLKNLKYDIEIGGKSVEFIGAPKFISSLEDLEVLLQIVNESELDSLYVMH